MRDYLLLLIFIALVALFFCQMHNMIERDRMRTQIAAVEERLVEIHGALDSLPSRLSNLQDL